MSLAFREDGAFAASGAQDGTVIVWDVANGDLLRQIATHSGVVDHLNFTSDGDALWSAGEDGTIDLWTLTLDATDLQNWIATHREAQSLTCLQQIQYGLTDHCPNDS